MHEKIMRWSAAPGSAGVASSTCACCRAHRQAKTSFSPLQVFRVFQPGSLLKVQPRRTSATTVIIGGRLPATARGRSLFAYA
jgi:hypothetical protein